MAVLLPTSDLSRQLVSQFECQDLRLSEAEAGTRIGRNVTSGEGFKVPPNWVQFSNVHCLITLRTQPDLGPLWTVLDRSTNGTYLNDERISKTEPHAMGDGDKLRLSQKSEHGQALEFEFRLVPASAGPSKATSDSLSAPAVLPTNHKRKAAGSSAEPGDGGAAAPKRAAPTPCVTPAPPGPRLSALAPTPVLAPPKTTPNPGWVASKDELEFISKLKGRLELTRKQLAATKVELEQAKGEARAAVAAKRAMETTQKEEVQGRQDAAQRADTSQAEAAAAQLRAAEAAGRQSEVEALLREVQKERSTTEAVLEALNLANAELQAKLQRAVDDNAQLSRQLDEVRAGAVAQAAALAAELAAEQQGRRDEAAARQAAQTLSDRSAAQLLAVQASSAQAVGELRAAADEALAHAATELRARQALEHGLEELQLQFEQTEERLQMAELHSSAQRVQFHRLEGSHAVLGAECAAMRGDSAQLASLAQALVRRAEKADRQHGEGAGLMADLARGVNGHAAAEGTQLDDGNTQLPMTHDPASSRQLGATPAANAAAPSSSFKSPWPLSGSRQLAPPPPTLHPTAAAAAGALLCAHHGGGGGGDMLGTAPAASGAATPVAVSPTASTSRGAPRSSFGPSPRAGFAGIATLLQDSLGSVAAKGRGIGGSGAGSLAADLLADTPASPGGGVGATATPDAFAGGLLDTRQLRLDGSAAAGTPVLAFGEPLVYAETQLGTAVVPATGVAGGSAALVDSLEPDGAAAGGTGEEEGRLPAGAAVGSFGLAPSVTDSDAGRDGGEEEAEGGSGARQAAGDDDEAMEVDSQKDGGDGGGGRSSADGSEELAGAGPRGVGVLGGLYDDTGDGGRAEGELVLPEAQQQSLMTVP